MLRLSAAVAWSFTIGTTVNLSPTSLILAIAGSLSGISAFLLVWSQRTKNTVDSMAVLFDRQRDINRERLETIESQVADLKERLRYANGDRKGLRKQLETCERERILLQDQIRGLDLTILELRGKDPDKDFPA